MTYVLLGVVAIIWYQVFFRVKDNLFGEETTVVQPNQQMAIFEPIVRDTFLLNANYRDPFGETKLGHTSAPPTSIQPASASVTSPPKMPTPWPAIGYFGQVVRKSSKNPLAIISVDGYKHTMRKGESIYDGILVKGVGRDSIVIRYKGENAHFLARNTVIL